MGFKEYERNMSFLGMELSKTLGTSRTQRVLKEIHDHIRWEPLERILHTEYPVGSHRWVCGLSPADAIEGSVAAEVVWDQV